jgi:hypothetical protein
MYAAYTAGLFQLTHSLKARMVSQPLNPKSENPISQNLPKIFNLYRRYAAAGIRYMLPDDSKVSMLLFLGVLGLVNLVGVGFIMAVGYAGGLFPELFSNVTWTVFAVAVLKGLVDNVLSDYLWARAVLLTSPTVASVGLSMQIPMAAVVEVMLGHARWMREARAYNRPLYITLA